MLQRSATPLSFMRRKRAHLPRSDLRVSRRSWASFLTSTLWRPGVQPGPLGAPSIWLMLFNVGGHVWTCWTPRSSNCSWNFGLGLDEVSLKRQLHQSKPNPTFTGFMPWFRNSLKKYHIVWYLRPPFGKKCFDWLTWILFHSNLLWLHQVCHQEVDIDNTEFVIAHGKSTFVKPDKVAKLQRENTTGGSEHKHVDNKSWCLIYCPMTCYFSLLTSGPDCLQPGLIKGGKVRTTLQKQLVGSVAQWRRWPLPMC